MQSIYDFAGFRLDIGERLLLKNGEPVSLQPKAFDLLCVLVENAGRLLEKDHLLKAVWPDAVVEEVNLANNVSILRKALGESEAQRFIETVPRRGYRFIGRPVLSVSQDNGSDTDIGQRAEATIVTSDSSSITSESFPDRAPEPSLAGKLTETRTSRHFIGLSIGALGALVLLAAAAAIYRFAPLRDSGTLPPKGFVRLTSDAGLSTEPVLSSDGSLLAYASDRSGQGNLDIWVQPLNGSEPLRLTDHPADDREPHFSPDGGRIVFRSERDGGGIYVVPALGGAARMIARGGRRPRFSPDGRYIAYWTGSVEFHASSGDISAPGTSSIFIVPASGGEPLQLLPDFAAARLPTWSPDSKKILFVGVREPNRPPITARPEIVDMWITPVDGGPPVKTDAIAALIRKGISMWTPSVWVAEGNMVLFSAGSGDSRNLWQIPISPANGKTLGEAERLTSGAAVEGHPLLAGRRLVFSSLNRNQDIWSLPIRSDDGHPTGDARPLVTSSAYDMSPYISSDGKKIAFTSLRSGKS